MIQIRIINYTLRHFQKLANTKKNSVKMGLETILYHTPQLWNLVPIDIKDTLSLSTFKKKKKKIKKKKKKKKKKKIPCTHHF